jgi:hypothetical protein
MGIWDDDGFANDEALDWLLRLEPGDGLQPLRQLMHAAIDGPDPALDARQAGRVLAAVELVAAAGGQPHPGLPERAREWCRAQPERPDEETRILATRALDFVGTSSGLAELWSQRADVAGWHQELDSLRMRLTPAAVPPPL